MTKLVQRLVFAQIMDAATFAAFFILVPISVHVERNPVIGTLYAMGGFALVACVKVLVTLIVGYRTIHQPLKHPRLVTILMSAATASGITGAAFNIGSLIKSL